MLFTLAADAQQRIKDFRSERIKTIASGKGLVQLAGGGRLILHLIPLSAFGQVAQIDLERAYQIHDKFQPMVDSMGITARFNLDGIINVRGGQEGDGYTQVFRNGILEATKAGILRPFSDKTILHAGESLRHIVEVLPGYFEGLRALDVPPPIVVMVSYQGVAHAKLAVHGYDLDKIERFPVDRLLLPDAIVEDYGSLDHYMTALKPAFDTLWNATGLFARCTYYDEDGNWQPPH